MRFGVLSRLEVIGDDGVEVRISQPRQRALLAVLLLHANKEVSAGRLAESVSDGGGSIGGSGALRTQVWALRRVLAPARRLHTGQYQGYVFEVRPDELDAARFRELASQGRTALEAGDLPGAADRLIQALALWEEPVLADVPMTLAMGPVVQRLTDERAAIRELLAEARLGLGQHADLVPELRERISADPINERLWEQLMLALHGAGRIGEALATYQQARTSIQAELGLEPGAGLQQLHHHILTGYPQSIQDAPPPAAAQRREPIRGGDQAPARATAGPSAESGAGRGAWLEQARAAAGLTQENLAARSGVSVRTISDLERGITTRPYPRSIRMLAKALALSTDQTSDIIAQYRDDGRSQRQRPTVGSNHALLPRNEEGAVAGSRWSPVPRCLPAGVRNFTGRTRELAIFDRLLEDASAPDGTVIISAISGTAGVGKTALALHWAHQVAGQFPDGHLYAGLRGFDPSEPPAEPRDILGEFLDALEVPSVRIPSGLAERAALYRSRLAGKRILVVLDNARDEQQVRPLLPGSPGCLVVITSRRQMHGLAASDGARLIPMDILAGDEASQLLTARLGHDRVAAEPEAVTKIVDLCARLPLALAITASRAAGNPRLPLAALAGELADTKDRLDVLDAGDPPTSMRAVFSCSYQNVPRSAQRMFGLLGLHPGPDISAAAAASLAGVTMAEARRDLKVLAQASLITEHVPARFTFHDLLRLYATELTSSGKEDSGPAATARMLDHYLHTAHAAVLLIRPARDPLPLRKAQPGVVPEHLKDAQEALDWFTGERQVLLTMVSLADRMRSDAHAWQMAWALSDFLDWRGLWHDWATTQRIALAAATRLGEPTAQAAAHLILGTTSSRLGDLDEAREHLNNCLGLYQQLGDNANQARTHQALSYVAEQQGRLADALYHAQHAVSLSEAADNLAGIASALNDVGWIRAHLGDYQQARTDCRKAIALLQTLGDQRTEAKAWDSLGYIEHQLGQYAKASRHYRQALDLLQHYRDYFGQVEALIGLGDSQAAGGDEDQARGAWHRALDILEDLHHPDAEQLRARLTERSPSAREPVTLSLKLARRSLK